MRKHFPQALAAIKRYDSEEISQIAIENHINLFYIFSSMMEMLERHGVSLHNRNQYKKEEMRLKSLLEQATKEKQEWLDKYQELSKKKVDVEFFKSENPSRTNQRRKPKRDLGSGEMKSLICALQEMRASH
jgi:hypothetical protein